jgi:hypothetical protein
LLTGIDKYLDIVYKDRYKPVINLLTTYMSKPIGGRGKKAPYETTHVRIPVDLKSKVEELVEDKSARNLPIDYHELVVKMIEEFKNNNLFIHENPDRKYPLTLILSREEAIEYGRTLVIQARTKKNVAENLLTALYQVDIKL